MKMEERGRNKRGEAKWVREKPEGKERRGRGDERFGVLSALGRGVKGKKVR